MESHAAPGLSLCSAAVPTLLVQRSCHHGGDRLCLLQGPCLHPEGPRLYTTKLTGLLGGPKGFRDTVLMSHALLPLPES